MRTATRLVVLAGMALACATAQSQTMYRCGKVYQDRPCDAGQAGKAIGSTGTGAAPAQNSAADPECVQRGRDSLKIVWAREGGATEERLVGEAGTAAQKRFVRDVYRRPGAASTVQVAVEADCVAEKRKREEDAAMAAAAAVLRAREGAPSSPATQPAVPPAADPAAEPRRTVQRHAIGGENKKEVCAGYNAQMEDYRAKERAGASAKTMDAINESRRRLRDQMSRAGC